MNTLEVKTLQKIVSMRKYVLYVIFVYTHKAYDTLDRWCALAML